MSFSSIKRKEYNIQRGASNGAAITLIALPGEYRAQFECATKCAEVLGDRALIDVGDGILDIIPTYRIPLEDLYAAITRLHQRFSVALVEYTLTSRGGQFVCLWRVNSTAQDLPETPSQDVNDY